MLASVYVISDSTLTDNIARTLKQCLDSGTPWVGIREYHMCDTALIRLTEDIVAYAEPLGARVSIWGKADIAERFGIGCHVNIHTYTPHLTAPIYPIGISTHTAQDIVNLRECDYITLSPVFDSISKSGYAGMGIDSFAKICTDAPVPVFALGGITADTAPIALAHGAHGVAICGAAMHNPNIIKALVP